MATPLTREQWLASLDGMVEKAMDEADAELASEPMSKRREKFLQALEVFEKAHAEFLDLGSIPEFSDDPEEQELIDAERARIKRAYKFRRNRLITLALWS